MSGFSKWLNALLSWGEPETKGEKFHVEHQDQDLEKTQRAAVIAEARSWIGTPFRWRAAVKGPQGGADCASFIAAVYKNAGVFDEKDAQIYVPPQFGMNQPDEIYLLYVQKHAAEISAERGGTVDTPEPADFLIVKPPRARSFWHGAIVEEWPWVIHCWGEQGVHRVNFQRHPLYLSADAKFFSPWKRQAK